MKALRIMAQTFYGNRTETDIDVKNLDRFILGYIDSNIDVTEKIDRTIIKIPNSDIVIIYNKYQEEKQLGKEYENKPLVVIPEMNLKIYSRCVVCRMNENEELKDFETEDYEVIKKYLAE